MTGNNSSSRRKPEDVAGRPWTGAVRDYDLLKELAVGVVVVGLLMLGVSAVFGSPDEPSVSLKAWATAAPADFVGTAAKELAGTSDTAGYGPPYSATPDASQKIGPVDLQSLSGVRLPVDTANDLVIAPLATLPSAPAALAPWKDATEQQRSAWAAAYSDALAAAPDNDPAKVAPGTMGRSRPSPVHCWTWHAEAASTACSRAAEISTAWTTPAASCSLETAATFRILQQASTSPATSGG